MPDLDPRTNTKDRMKPLGEMRLFGLGRMEEQVTSIGNGLKETQPTTIGRKLKSNNDLFHMECHRHAWYTLVCNGA